MFTAPRFSGQPPVHHGGTSFNLMYLMYCRVVSAAHDLPLKSREFNSPAEAPRDFSARSGIQGMGQRFNCVLANPITKFNLLSPLGTLQRFG